MAGPCAPSKKPSFRAKKGLTGLPDSIKQTVRRHNAAAGVGCPEDTLETLLHSADQGPRRALCPSDSPSLCTSDPAELRRGATGSAWLGVKVTISSFLGLAFLVHGGGGWWAGVERQL